MSQHREVNHQWRPQAPTGKPLPVLSRKLRKGQVAAIRPKLKSAEELAIFARKLPAANARADQQLAAAWYGSINLLAPVLISPK